MGLSKKLISMLARAPVLLLLTIIFLAGHPTRAEAETILKPDMTGFVTIGDHDVIQTKGKYLNNMFGCHLDPERQYLAYYKIDKKRSSSIYWYTYKEYWHQTPFNGCVVPQNPSKSNGVFNVVNVKNANASSKITGKASFTGSYQTSLGGSIHYVPSGGIGTLHYFCTDAGTTTGDKFLEYLDPDKGTVKFYISPVIKTSVGQTCYSLSEWKSAQGWRDTSTFADHYNVPFVFKPASIKVTSTACLVGAKRTDNSPYEIADYLYYHSNDKEIRGVTTEDQIYAPKMKEGSDGKNVRVPLKVTGANGKELKNGTTKYYRFFSQKQKTKADAIALTSPIAQKGADMITYKTSSGKTKSAVLVGFTVYKRVKLKTGTKSIYLANCMIELRKNASGQYVPYYVEDKSRANVKEEVDEDGETIAKPSSILDYHVTVASYKKCA